MRIENSATIIIRVRGKRFAKRILLDRYGAEERPGAFYKLVLLAVRQVASVGGEIDPDRMLFPGEKTYKEIKNEGK